MNNAIPSRVLASTSFIALEAAVRNFSTSKVRRFFVFSSILTYSSLLCHFTSVCNNKFSS